MNTDSIEKRIVLRAPLDRVWRALSDHKEFGTWFGVRLDKPFAPGATIRAVIAPTKVQAEVADVQKKHEGVSFELTIERMEPERLFTFRWHPNAVDPSVDYSAEPTTLVEFSLEPLAEGVQVTVRESGFNGIPLVRRAKAFTSNDNGWSLMVKSLDQYVTHAQQK